MEMQNVKLAILDMYDGTTNQGMRAIKQIVETFGSSIDYQVFDVRGKAEVPGLNFDIYISTGGPGSPLDGDGHWDKLFFQLIDELFLWNQHNETKKFVFLICHSFQMVCAHLNLGQITKRKSMSFGTFPVHPTNDGKEDLLLKALPDPFYVADFRHWQFIQPDENRFAEVGAEILALEKIRPHIELERAIMAIRFSPEIFGTQFHPEADKDGMLLHFLKEENKSKVLKEYGMAKYQGMIRDLGNPRKIELTHDTVIPTFLNQAIEATINIVVNV